MATFGSASQTGCYSCEIVCRGIWRRGLCICSRPSAWHWKILCCISGISFKGWNGGRPFNSGSERTLPFTNVSSVSMCGRTPYGPPRRRRAGWSIGDANLARPSEKTGSSLSRVSKGDYITCRIPPARTQWVSNCFFYSYAIFCFGRCWLFGYRGIYESSPARRVWWNPRSFWTVKTLHRSMVTPSGNREPHQSKTHGDIALLFGGGKEGTRFKKSDCSNRGRKDSFLSGLCTSACRTIRVKPYYLCDSIYEYYWTDGKSLSKNCWNRKCAGTSCKCQFWSTGRHRSRGRTVSPFHRKLGRADHCDHKRAIFWIVVLQ